ncbi:hypothetical protein CDAR_503101 [Caerostris darwini]|uniref:Uncharacterized protein n=1 Tax=Caerostris darwini TaxID=1538125 RepID=A0AAV4VLC9_9ARAC|nr:hypothetical protein CDAR_503101 [Caerostris darwini]
MTPKNFPQLILKSSSESEQHYISSNYPLNIGQRKREAIKRGISLKHTRRRQSKEVAETAIHFHQLPFEHRAKKKGGHQARHLSETHQEATQRGSGRVNRPNCDVMNRSDARS